jgi:hypothetical protein
VIERRGGKKKICVLIIMKYKSQARNQHFCDHLSRSTQRSFPSLLAASSNLGWVRKNGRMFLHYNSTSLRPLKDFFFCFKLICNESFSRHFESNLEKKTVLDKINRL